MCVDVFNMSLWLMAVLAWPDGIGQWEHSSYNTHPSSARLPNTKRNQTSALTSGAPHFALNYISNLVTWVFLHVPPVWLTECPARLSENARFDQAVIDTDLELYLAKRQPLNGQLEEQ